MNSSRKSEMSWTPEWMNVLEKQFASQMCWSSPGDDGDHLDVAEGPLLLQAGVSEGGLCQEEEEEAEEGRARPAERGNWGAGR